MIIINYLGNLKQTFPSSQRHQFSSGDPSVTGKKNGISFWSRHHYFGEVPLIVLAEQKRIFLHLHKQELPQRQTGFQGVGPCLEIGINVNINKVSKKCWKRLFSNHKWNAKKLPNKI